MATSRFQPRSISSVRECRRCEGSGEVGEQERGPDCHLVTCGACGGSGRDRGAPMDVLHGLRYLRSYGRGSRNYAETKARAMRPVALPGAV